MRVYSDFVLKGYMFFSGTVATFFAASSIAVSAVRESFIVNSSQSGSSDCSSNGIMKSIQSVIVHAKNLSKFETNSLFCAGLFGVGVIFHYLILGRVISSFEKTIKSESFFFDLFRIVYRSELIEHDEHLQSVWQRVAGRMNSKLFVVDLNDVPQIEIKDINSLLQIIKVDVPELRRQALQNRSNPYSLSMDSELSLLADIK